MKNDELAFFKGGTIVVTLIAIGIAMLLSSCSTYKTAYHCPAYGMSWDVNQGR